MKTELLRVVLDVRNQLPVQDRLLFDALALSGKSGELANIVKRALFYPGESIHEHHQELIDTLSDVLFHVQSLAYELDITLEELTTYCIEKQQRRLSGSDTTKERVITS